MQFIILVTVVGYVAAIVFVTAWMKKASDDAAKEMRQIIMNYNAEVRAMISSMNQETNSFHGRMLASQFQNILKSESMSGNVPQRKKQGRPRKTPVVGS